MTAASSQLHVSGSTMTEAPRTDPRPNAAPDPAGGPSRWVAWGTVSVLLFLCMVSFLDRQIISLMVQPIRLDLGVSDFEISLLQGFAFALFFTLFGLPLGWLVDRAPRRWVIYGGVTVWSLATIACGFAQNWGMLFLARLGVGAGEAALSPAAYSMIADVFPRRRLATALAVYAAGANLGAAAAIVVGGLLIQHLEGVSVPFAWLGEPATWQLAFIAVGVPGLAAALLIFAVPEPRRTRQVGREGADEVIAGLGGFLKRRSGFFTCHFIGFGCVSAIGYGMLAWTPTYLMREYGLTVAQVGALVGLLVAACGVPGGILSGFVVDRLFARGRSDAHLRAYVVVCAIVVLLSAVAFSVHNLTLFIVLMGLLQAVLPFSGAATAALQIVTPSHFRGRVSALFLFVYSLIGLGLGPTAVAVVSDFVLRDEARLGLAMAITTGAFGLVGGVAFALGLGPMRRAVGLASEDAPAAAPATAR